MDVNKCIIMLILTILFAAFIAEVLRSIVDINNKITEMFDDISLLKIASNNTLLAMNSYYSTIKENQTEIEKNLLIEIACLATKNNNDIKEIKDKITTGKKNKRISQLIDENNKLKKKNEELKEENTKLNEENNKLKKEKSNIVSNNNVFSYHPIPIYNPYTGVVNFHGYNAIKANNYECNYEW